MVQKDVHLSHLPWLDWDSDTGELTEQTAPTALSLSCGQRDPQKENLKDYSFNHFHHRKYQ